MNKMIDFEDLLHLVEAGDSASLDRLAAEGELEGFSDAEKSTITRAAARSGRTNVLRRLFEQ